MCQEDNGYKVYVLFTINGKDLPLPEEINQSLGCKGTGFNTGDIYYTNNKLEKHTRTYSVWSVDTRHYVVSDNIMDHLTCILTLLESKTQVLRRYLDSPDALVFVNVRVESADWIARVVIPSPMLIRLAYICNEVCIVAIAGNGQ